MFNIGTKGGKIVKTIICNRCKKEVDIELNACPSCGCSMEEIRSWYLTKFKTAIEHTIKHEKCYKCFKGKYNLEKVYLSITKNFIMTDCSNCGMPIVLCPITEEAKEEIRIQTEIAIAKAKVQLAYAPKKPDPNIPRCPVCRSPEIRKIGAGKRAVHGAAFGLFSKTARSQWECKHCGNKW